jgi:hypothetical protein
MPNTQKIQNGWRNIDTLDSIEHTRMAAFQELESALRIKYIHQELLQYLSSSLMWILHYCKKNNFEVPEQEKIMRLIDNAIAIEAKLPTDFQSQTKTSDDLNS